MTDTAALRRVEYMALAEIIGADNNPKGHDQDLLGDSVRRFGFTEPAVLDERTGKLVAGHGRLDQLRIMLERGDDPPDGVVVAGDDWAMPVIRGWASTDDREAQAYLIASNRITERGGWDREGLLSALHTLEGELSGVGFTSADIESLQARMDAERDRAGWDDDSVSDDNDPTGQRTLTLDYDLATFERVVEMATHARSTHGVNSNADLFRILLEADACA